VRFDVCGDGALTAHLPLSKRELKVCRRFAGAVVLRVAAWESTNAGPDRK
jgi:hypothetical protein